MATAFFGLHPAFLPPQSLVQELVLPNELSAGPFPDVPTRGGSKHLNSGRPRHGIQSDLTQGGVVPESNPQRLISGFKRTEDSCSLELLLSSPVSLEPHLPKTLGQKFVSVSQLDPWDAQIGGQAESVQPVPNGIERRCPRVKKLSLASRHSPSPRQSDGRSSESRPLVSLCPTDRTPTRLGQPSPPPPLHAPHQSNTIGRPSGEPL